MTYVICQVRVYKSNPLIGPNWRFGGKMTYVVCQVRVFYKSDPIWPKLQVWGRFETCISRTPSLAQTGGLGPKWPMSFVRSKTSINRTPLLAQPGELGPNQVKSYKSDPLYWPNLRVGAKSSQVMNMVRDFYWSDPLLVQPGKLGPNQARSWT